MIVTRNGNKTIVLNPNSQKTSEFVLMHELTHAVGTEEIQDMILDYAKKNNSFNEIVENVKANYETNEINEEVMCDVTGELLGNQEFLNTLSIENPNLFKKIMDAIVDLLNKVTKNSNEYLFLKDLQNKFENAYYSKDNESYLPNLLNHGIIKKIEFTGSNSQQTQSIKDNTPQKDKNVNDTSSTKYSMQEKDKNTQELDNSSFNLKEKQNKIIQNSNPAGNETATWIRNTADIKTFEETLQDSDYKEYFDAGEDFDETYTANMAKKALETGEITVYSSYPIEQGVFVTPSKLEASQYAKVNQQNIPINRELVKQTKGNIPINKDISITSDVNQNTKSLEERVTGDVLLDAQDLIVELKSAGAEIDKNGYVTLYHQTTKENAQKIIETGKMSAKEDYVYFSTSKNASQSDGRGSVKLEFKIPVEKLILDDIFEDNADVKMPLNNNKTLDVSNYLVNNQNKENIIISEELFSKEIEDALNNNQSKGNIIIAVPKNNRVINLIKKISGIDISNRRQILSKDYIRHLFKHSNETNPGQISITMNDIKRIPDVLSNPDDIVKGSETLDASRKNKILSIRYIKADSTGKIFVIEAIPNKGDLQIKTMWKESTKLIHSNNALHHTSETANSNNLTTLIDNNIPQSNTNVKSDTSSTKYSMQKNGTDTQNKNSNNKIDKNKDMLYNKETENTVNKLKEDPYEKSSTNKKEETNRRGNGNIESTTVKRKMGENEIAKENYKKFEQNATKNTTKELTKEQEQLNNDLKTLYNKEVVFFDGNNLYHGGSSTTDSNKIYVDYNLDIKDQTFIAYHEILENLIYHNKYFRDTYSNDLINEIINDKNFVKNKNNFIESENEINYDKWKEINNRLIAKEILCDVFADRTSNIDKGYDIKLEKETQDYFDYVIERATNSLKPKVVPIKNKKEKVVPVKQNIKEMQQVQETAAEIAKFYGTEAETQDGGLTIRKILDEKTPRKELTFKEEINKLKNLKMIIFVY